MGTVGNTCQALRRDGQPCTVRALPGQPWCFAHSPETAQRRAEATARGGRNSSTAARLRKKVASGPLATVQEVLLQSIAGVLTGRIDPRRATAVAALSGALVRCYQAGEQDALLRAMQTRLEALEREQAPAWRQG